MLRATCRIASVLAALVLAAGYAGPLDVRLDTFALLRVPAAALLLLSAMGLAGVRRWTAAGVALAVLATWAVPRFQNGHPGGDLTIYQKNVLYFIDDLDPLAEDIRRSGADVVTLQELQDDTYRLLDMLRPEYPYQISCPDAGFNNTAVLSRLPVVDGSVCLEWVPFSALWVRSPEGPVWVGSLHLSYPWPGGQQSQQVPRVIEALARMDGPVVLGGDFNNVPWSHAVGTLAEAAGARPLTPWRPTRFLAPAEMAWHFLTVNRQEPGPPKVFRGWLPVSIDHVLAASGRLALRPMLGSDHFGILADVAIR